MIISKKHKYVFISTPKTGSHTMFNILQNQFDGVRYGPDKGYAFHEWRTPKRFTKYFHFSTVRNPYSRFVALWNSCLMVGKDSKKRIPKRYRDSYMSVLGNDNILTFAKYLAKNKNSIEHNSQLRFPLLLIPQWRWYEKYLPEGIKYLKLENLEEEINSLPFFEKPVTMVHKLKREYKGWDELKTPELIQYVNEWAEYDFEKFEYIKEEL